MWKWGKEPDDEAARAERVRRADEWLRAEKIRRQEDLRRGDGLPPRSERFLTAAELRQEEKARRAEAERAQGATEQWEAEHRRRAQEGLRAALEHAEAEQAQRAAEQARRAKEEARRAKEQRAAERQAARQRAAEQRAAKRQEVERRRRVKDELRAGLQRADAEPDPTARARATLSILADFLTGSDPELVRKQLSLVGSRTAEACEVLGGEALALLGPFSDLIVDTHVAREVVRRWMRRPDERDFDAAWDVAVGFKSNRFRAWWLDALANGGGEIAPEFRRLAVRRIVALTHRQFRTLADSADITAAWQVLFAVGPPSRAVWYRRLADHAARGGDHRVAADRYRLAATLGDATAAARLERFGDAAAYRALCAGKEPAPQPWAAEQPSGYQRLLDAAWRLARGLPSADLPAVADCRGDAGTSAAIHFVTALALWRAGNRTGARLRLARMIDDIDEPSAVEPDLLANARLLLGVLSGDDQEVVDAARSLLDRHRDGWRARCVVDSRTVLTAVAWCDPTLSAALIGGDAKLAAVLVALAGTMVAGAVRAALSSDLGRARALADQALRLLEDHSDDDCVRLREAAAKILTLTGSLVDLPSVGRLSDRLAFTALRRDGVVQPWTEHALEIWQESAQVPDVAPETLHHLAIAQHARAFQLELAGDENAHVYWDLALRSWARLHGDARFWELVRARLTEAMTDAAEQEIARAVDEARDELPARLLAVHVSRAKQLSADRPALARKHVDSIRRAPFPADGERARREVLREVSGQARRLAKEGRTAVALDALERWVRIDRDSLPLAELVLDVGIAAAASLTGDVNGWAAFEKSLKRVGGLVEPLRAARGLSTKTLATSRTRTPARSRGADIRDFADKVARYEFWIGTCRLMLALQRDSLADYTRSTEFRAAAEHLEVAMLLGLPAADPYDQAGQFLAAARNAGRRR